MTKMVKSSIHNLPRPLARRAPYREPRKRVLIFCEGTVSEPQYFDDFRRHEHNPLVDVVIDDEGGSPKTLVERAAQRKKTAEKEAERFRDEHLKYDEVWCVYDIDSPERVNDFETTGRSNLV